MGKVPFLSDRCRSLATLVSDSLTAKLTNWLTHSFLVDLTEVTLAIEEANSKLHDDVVSVADFDTKECVDERLVYISKLMFDRDFEPKCQEKILSVMFCQDFEARFWSWSFVGTLRLNLGQDFESPSLKLKFGRDFGVKFWWRQKWSTIFFQLDFQNPIYLHSKTAFRNLSQQSHTHRVIYIELLPSWVTKVTAKTESGDHLDNEDDYQLALGWLYSSCHHLITSSLWSSPNWSSVAGSWWSSPS